MKSVFTLSILFILHFHCDSQIYVGNDSWRKYFIEINNDSIIVERYLFTPDDKVFLEWKNDFLIQHLSTDTLISANSLILFRKEKKILLKPTLSKNKVITLKKSNLKARQKIRNRAMISLLTRHLNQLYDSFSNPYKKCEPYIEQNFQKIQKQFSFDTIFYLKAKQLHDSLALLIVNHRHPVSDNYFYIASVLHETDTAEVFRLLQNANYRYYYSCLFLYRLTIEKPEYLLSYLSTSPPNYRTTIRCIRNNEHNKEMIAAVEKTGIDTPAARKIIQQKNIIRLKEKLPTSTTIIYIVVEASILILIFQWIF